jgi:hypothetical protein
VLHALAVTADRLGATGVARVSLSGMYGITYYASLADALGAPAAVRTALRRGTLLHTTGSSPIQRWAVERVIAPAPDAAARDDTRVGA